LEKALVPLNPIDMTRLAKINNFHRQQADSGCRRSLLLRIYFSALIPFEFLRPAQQPLNTGFGLEYAPPSHPRPDCGAVKGAPTTWRVFSDTLSQQFTLTLVSSGRQDVK
jgi:hypothetical protein